MDKYYNLRFAEHWVREIRGKIYRISRDTVLYCRFDGSARVENTRIGKVLSFRYNFSFGVLLLSRTTWAKYGMARKEAC